MDHLDDQERVQTREDLLDAIDLMERQHNGLIDGDAGLNLPGNPSAQARALLFEPPLRLDAQVRDYLATARSLTNESPAEVDALEQQVSASAPQLLDALDAAVSQYVRDRDSSQALNRVFYGAALTLTLVALVLIGVFLFRPMVRRVRRETRALEALTQSLEQLVTDRTRVAEQRAGAAERAEGRYRALFEDAPVMYVTTRDEAGIPVVSDCNLALLGSLGYDREEIVGKPLANIYSDESQKEMESGGDRTALQGVSESERELVAEDGRVLNTLTRAVPALDENGKAGGTRAAFVDVTAQRRAEDQVRAQVQRLEALHDIELSITATLDVRVVLGTLLDQLTARLDIAAADVLLLDASTQRLEYAAGRGFRSSQMRGKAPRLGESYPGRAAMERRTVSVLNLAEHSDPCLDAEWLTGEGFTAYHGAPLVAKGEVKGVLEVFHREGQPDDPE